jgi:hypothetical protein
VLALFQQLAVVAEEAMDAFFNDEGLEDADGEMGFAYADGAGEEEAAAFSRDWITVHELPRFYMR